MSPSCFLPQVDVLDKRGFSFQEKVDSKVDKKEHLKEQLRALESTLENIHTQSMFSHDLDSLGRENEIEEKEEEKSLPHFGLLRVYAEYLEWKCTQGKNLELAYQKLGE